MLPIGLGGLTSTPPLLQSLDVVDSAEHSLTIKATLVVWNPSNISAPLGDLSFLWSYDGFLIGMATVPDLTLQPGNNTVNCIGMMNPSIDCAHNPRTGCDPELAVQASREFISKYISGEYLIRMTLKVFTKRSDNRQTLLFLTSRPTRILRARR